MHREPQDSKDNSPAEDDVNAFITVEDAVKLTSLTERTIRTYIKSGRIPSYRIPTGKPGKPVKRHLVRLKKRDVMNLMRPAGGAPAA